MSINSTCIWLNDWETVLPGDVTHDHLRDYLCGISEVGYQKPNGPSARARTLAAIRSFFKYAHRAGLLRDNPAADIPLPKIRWVKSARCLTRSVIVSADSRIESKPFSKSQRQGNNCYISLNRRGFREIVDLDKGDIDLRQATIRLHRKGGEVNILPLPFRQDRTQSVFKAPETQEPNTGVVHILPQSKDFTSDCLVFSKEIFQEISNQRLTEWDHTLCATPSRHCY